MPKQPREKMAKFRAAGDWDHLYLQRDEMTPEQLKARYELLVTEERAIEGANPPGEGAPKLKAALEDGMNPDGRRS